METKIFNSKVSSLVMTAMIMCIIIVTIFMLRVPIPFTQGYVNLSDGVIFIGVLLLGRRNGCIAAALGSMMGDIIGGFAMWAPWTFVIKGGMAFIMATVCMALIKSDMSESKKWIIRVGGMVLGGIFMVAGYFLAEGVMYGNWLAAALGAPWNVAQFMVGVVLATAIYVALEKTSIIRNR